MKKILFQFFDSQKWLVIGFANFGGGGGGADFNYPDNPRKEVQKLNERSAKFRSRSSSQAFSF